MLSKLTPLTIGAMAATYQGRSDRKLIQGLKINNSRQRGPRVMDGNCADGAYAVNRLKAGPENIPEVLEQMDAIEEGEGTLLDHSMVTLGSGLGDGKDHTMDELPIIVAGSANGRIKTGRILRCPENTPLANLWLSQAQLMGTGLERFADSTGPLKGLLG